MWIVFIVCIVYPTLKSQVDSPLSLLPASNVRFDCVYPTRVARFGVAIVPSGTMRLKAKEYAKDLLPVEEGERLLHP